MTAGWRVEVIRERCLSTANCLATAPGFFDLDEDGIATVIGRAGESAASPARLARKPSRTPLRSAPQPRCASCTRKSVRPVDTRRQRAPVVWRSLPVAPR